MKKILLLISCIWWIAAADAAHSLTVSAGIPFAHTFDKHYRTAIKKYTGMVHGAVGYSARMDSGLTLGGSMGYMLARERAYDTTLARLHVAQVEFHIGFLPNRQMVLVEPYLEFGAFPTYLQKGLGHWEKEKSSFHFGLDAKLGVRVIFRLGDETGIGPYAEYGYMHTFGDSQPVVDLLVLRIGLAFHFIRGLPEIIKDARELPYQRKVKRRY